MAKVAQEDTLLKLYDLLATNRVSASTLNSRSIALGIDETWTGKSELNAYNEVMVVVKTDQSGILYMEFSVDGTNWDSSLSFSTTANTNEVHTLVKGARYYRTRFSNTSGAAQTYFRLQTAYGNFRQLNSPLNGVVQADSDSLLVRPMDFNLMIAQGLYQNTNNTIKDGINFDIDSGSTPEDITNEGGTYAGFATSAAASEIVAAGADTGTVYYSYMATDTDTDYTFGSKEITGIGTYALGHNIWRCNFAYFVNTGAPTSFNAGDITIRQTAAPTTVFCVITAGYSQSFCSAYTVPYGSSVYLDRVSGNMRGSTSGSLDGVFYYKPYGESPRYRFPFELQYGSLYFDDIDYLVRIPQRVDFIPRILTCSTNNLSAKITIRLLKIKS